MKLKADRDAARQAEVDRVTREALPVAAAAAEAKAAQQVAAGDANAMVDVLDHVVALHAAGYSQEADALAGRIKATLGAQDAAEADAYVAAKAPPAPKGTDGIDRGRGR